MDNGLSFVRDFERLLGDDIFRQNQKFYADADGDRLTVWKAN